MTVAIEIIPFIWPNYNTDPASTKLFSLFEWIDNLIDRDLSVSIMSEL
jgi:hypothetical protein